MAIKMASNELVDLCLGGGMEVLKFVHRLELDDVEPVREHPIRLPLQQMLCLVGRNV
jgi:hypothetical protein